VFGAIVPSTFLFSSRGPLVQLRKWMLAHCQIREIDLLPDRIFSHADQECAVLIGRRIHPPVPKGSRTRLRAVHDSNESRAAFQKFYRFSSTRLVPQSEFSRVATCRLWVAESQASIWKWVDGFDRLEQIATVGRGISYFGESKLSPGTITRQDVPFKGSEAGFDAGPKDWKYHLLPPFTYFNTDPQCVERVRSGLGRQPQVLLNHHRTSRLPWRLQPFIDSHGYVFSSKMMAARPKAQEITLEYLWALLISPVANLFTFHFHPDKHISEGVLLSLPVPDAKLVDVRLVTLLVKRFLTAASEERTIWNLGGKSGQVLMGHLLDIDAEVLRLYDFPAKAENVLLSHFREIERPGLGFRFASYPEAGKASVPLSAFLSKTYQLAVAGEVLPPSEEFLSELDHLERMDQPSDDDVLRLWEMRRELEGWEFVIGPPKKEKAESTDLIEYELKRIAERIASLDLKDSQK